MIVDAESRVALSSLGWVDGGSIWSVGADESVPRRIALSDARYLTVRRSGDAERVAVIHHYDGYRWAITVHDFADLPTVVMRLSVDGGRVRLDGDPSAFDGLPRLHVTYLEDNETGLAGYFLIDLTGSAVRVRRLDWFTSDSFDELYQGVIAVLEVPGAGYLFSVQRSSELLLCSPSDLRILKVIPLADRGGNPSPVFLPNGRQLLVVDYDTVAILDVQTWTVVKQWMGQPPGAGRARQFLGDVWLPDSGNEIVVARPFSSDVVALDPHTLEPGRSWRTGRQPLRAVLLGQRLIARDWKSGDLVEVAD